MTKPVPSASPLAGLAPATPVQVEAPGILRTSRMTLRPLSASDREAYLRSVRVSRAALDASMTLHRAGETDDQMFDRQLAVLKNEQAAGHCFRCIGILDDGRIAGGFNLNAISRGLELKADIAWWVASDLTGRGLGSEGVAALVEYALADLPSGLGLHQVCAWITSDNTASIRLAQRVGLRKQGQERSYLQTGERWAVHDLFIRHAWDEPLAPR